MTKLRDSATPAPEMKKSTILLSAELYWLFQETQGRRRVNNHTAITQAVQQWIDGAASPSQHERVPENEHWHGLLADILASGDREAIMAVQQNLQVFHRLMRPKEEL